jgi:sialidase-1
LHVIKSKDNGKTWSKPIDITSQIAKPEWHNNFKFITSGRGIQTSSGKLLHCMVNLNNGMHVFGSDDHGKSWKLYDVPIKPANESKIVELHDGRWMINSRANNKGVRYVHISDDEGKTWETHAEEALIDPSCNASIIQYDFKKKKKGTPLIFSNANDAEKRENMTVRISFDNGKTWSKGKTIYKGGSAYSTLTVLANGDIGICFEKDDYKENVFVSFSFDWLLDEN